MIDVMLTNTEMYCTILSFHHSFTTNLKEDYKTARLLNIISLGGKKKITFLHITNLFFFLKVLNKTEFLAFEIVFLNSRWSFLQYGTPPKSYPS